MKNTCNQYCLKLLDLGVKHNKVLANLVMGLGSQKVSSVVGLCENPVFHYQYSSITDAVSHLSRKPLGLAGVNERLLGKVFGLLGPLPEVVTLATDKTVIPKPHSPTLEGRTMVAVANASFQGAKSVSVGYEYSWVNLQMDGWSLPLDSERIDLERTAAQVAGAQVLRLMTMAGSPLRTAPLVINDLDSGYGGPGYLDVVKDISNLVSVVNLRHGSKIYDPAAEGSNPCKVYGTTYYLLAKDRYQAYLHPQRRTREEKLQTSIVEHRPPDEDVSWDTTLKNGTAIRLRARRFKGLIQRTVDGVSMRDKPLDVVMVEANYPDGRPVFDRPQFLGIYGQQRHALSTQDAPKTYQKRYAIEPFFRFTKQNMALGGLQTPVCQNLNNWMMIVIAACWLLFFAARDLQNQPKKWQKYAAANRIGDPVCSLPQAQKAALKLLLTFDSTPFLPQKSKPGPGRQKGMRQPQRTKHRYVRKDAKKSQKMTKSNSVKPQ